VTIENTPFKTRARTIDHLGREQIADCPTAISELWKNSYDAYARMVELNIFDAIDNGFEVACLVDDGHGMSKKEFIEKWLVVGTESKATDQQLFEEDRNNLPIRPKQGQKGIGRLSCAAMGNLLLLVSKRKSEPFVAALIDWRIFSNPFLVLDDIKLPVVEFDSKEDLSTYLPEMFDALMGNLWGSQKIEDKDRDSRILAAWERLKHQESKQNINLSTQSEIENTIIQSSFEEKHFDSWPVWKNNAEHGTALFISKISDDLIAQLSLESVENDKSLVNVTKRKLFETLSGFIDPYSRENEEAEIADFSASVIAWNGNLQRVIIDKTNQFNIKNIDQLEHMVEGNVDEYGVFRGTLRVLGEEIRDVEIKPSEPVSLSTSGRVGPFSLRFGTFEYQIGSTTHTKEQLAWLNEQANLYAGFRMYRDGFRIMPYGREDNDYFKIEKRRSMNAGAYFWASRRMFGGIKISSKENPNLRDKAGREGLIDNMASKQFREITTNLLIVLGQEYFGRNSDNRKDLLPKIQAERRAEKYEQDKKKLINKQRKDIRNQIRSNLNRLIDLGNSIDSIVTELANGNLLNTESEALELQKNISALSGERKELTIGPVSFKLGSVEDEYLEYRKQEKKIATLLSQINSSLSIALEKFSPKAPEEIIAAEFQRNKTQIIKRVRSWASVARNELKQEEDRLDGLVQLRTNAYQEAVGDVSEKVLEKKLTLSEALNKLSEEYEVQSTENEEIFPPYITALQSLREMIDLQNLATLSLSESEQLREDLDRINALAQLGIAVEIVGHEIAGLDVTIERGLTSLPDTVKSTVVYENILNAHHSLSDKWRFLSPLKLSGERIPRKINGKEIETYIREFFREYLDRSDIKFEVTEGFKSFRFTELPSRIYPVFVNLVNNARYWVRHSSEVEKKIVLDYVGGKVIIADNGPGVEEHDLPKLFSLFFTKKASGGRGVGLYLCRVNLAAGGHKIHYETDLEKKLLPGANFVIEFKGIR